MVVPLVLLTFLFFIAVDYFLHRRETFHTVAVEVRAQPVRLDANYVDGFLVPENVSYHSGHGWLVRERPHAVRFGADEFAAALLGKIEKVELPQPGQWIRQGQKVLSFYKDGAKTEMVSPTEGEVMEINAEILLNTGITDRDITVLL